MNRIFSAVCAAAVLALSISANVFAAGTATVTISTDKRGTAPTDITAAGEGVSIKNLISDLGKLTNSANVSHIEQALTVSSKCDEPVQLALKLDISDYASKNNLEIDAEDVLDFFDIEIKDNNGNVYSSRDDAYIPALTREISLGTFNGEGINDTKQFEITVYKDAEADDMSYRNAARNAAWTIAMVGNSDDGGDIEDTAAPEAGENAVPEAVDTMPPAITLAPQPVTTIAPVVTLAPQTQTTSTMMPTVTMRPSALGSTSRTVTLAAGTYTAGQDISVGKYTITGNGMVEHYSSDGVLKTRLSLTSSGNGVREYTIELKAGDRVTLTDSVTFTPYSAVRATSSPRPTSKPRATSSPRPTSTPRATAAPKATTAPRATTAPKNSSSNSKSNPKTGDNTPLIPLAICAVSALAAIAIIEVKKRKMK